MRRREHSRFAGWRSIPTEGIRAPRTWDFQSFGNGVSLTASDRPQSHPLAHQVASSVRSRVAWELTPSRDLTEVPHHDERFIREARDRNRERGFFVTVSFFTTLLSLSLSLLPICECNWSLVAILGFRPTQSCLHWYWRPENARSIPESMRRAVMGRRRTITTTTKTRGGWIPHLFPFFYVRRSHVCRVQFRV